MNGANGRGVSPSGIILDSAHEHRDAPPHHHQMEDPYYSRRPMARDDEGAEPEPSSRYEEAAPEQMESVGSNYRYVCERIFSNQQPIDPRTSEYFVDANVTSTSISMTSQDFTGDDIDPSSAVGFANDGSFAEFAQGVIEQKKVRENHEQTAGDNDSY